MLLSWLQRRFIGKTKNSRPITRRRNSFRPLLEALEDRLAPAATFRWTGAINTNWSNAGNWTVLLGVGTYPGANPADVGDHAYFDRATTNNCILTQSLTVKNLEINGTFAGKLTVWAGFQLTVKAGLFDMATGTLLLENDARLNLRINSNSVWRGGIINNGPGSGNGKIYIFDSASLTVLVQPDLEKLCR